MGANSGWRGMGCAVALWVSASSAQAVSFVFDFLPGTSAQEQASFIAAGQFWSTFITDPITVRVTAGTQALGPNLLGQAESRFLTSPYADVRSALVADQTSTLDALAVSNLTPGSSVGLLINRVSDNPNGATSFTGFVDNNGSDNNSTLRLTSANARALGLSVPTGGISGRCTDCDGYIVLDTGWAWDHDRSDGISAGAFDFVGVVAHELGHTLGFISGVDDLDLLGDGTLPSNSFVAVSTLDLYRWSATSRASNVIDFRVGPDAKYFSVDRGLTQGAGFATGPRFGDGMQASHWRDDSLLGMMDPTLAPGELVQVTQNDLDALDAIGFQVTAVPEPSTWALMIGGLGVIGACLRRRRA